MNEKLKELYYQDDVIIGSKQNFINIAKKSLNASTKEINEFLKNQEINQVNKKQNKHNNLRITAPPRTYQIDIMYYPVGENFKNVLLIVDIQSRKAWAYVISSTSGENILTAYKKFESEVDIINAIEGDNQFSFKAFQDYNNDKNIRLDTSIAKEEHISSHGNKLGIIDRLVRTLKEMIEKYRSIVSKQTSFPEIIDKVINTYNNQPHRTIKTTPNEMFNDVSKQNFNNHKDKEYNRNDLKNNISIGVEARILESKGKLEKGSQKYSMDLYKLVGRDGNRFIVQDAEGNKQRRKLKPSEIQVIKQVDNKIDRNIIKEHAAEKKQRQVINKLIRGAEMKKDEAKKALEQLNIPEEKIKRAKKIDYAVLSDTTFRNKKEVVKQINTPNTPVATIKKTESKPKKETNNETWRI